MLSYKKIKAYYQNIRRTTSNIPECGFGQINNNTQRSCSLLKEFLLRYDLASFNPITVNNAENMVGIVPTLEKHPEKKDLVYITVQYSKTCFRISLQVTTTTHFSL